MNKNQFRIIFNQARGLMMAVAEHVKSNPSTASSASKTKNLDIDAVVESAFTSTIRPLIFSIMLSLEMVGIVSFTREAHADGIIADHHAPVSQRPVVTQAANGVPLINIQTPSAAGVSRNTYSQLDVNHQGAILNNSRTNVQTQLGGYVQGNPYLASGTARVILNEVNSSNPSLLNGYVEIAGSRAQLVIANPAGISCNGCGFINANRITLTTGTPVMNSGDLIGYRVTGGAINFLGAGLDGSQVNYTDVIARAVNVNAGMFANDLRLITGSNQVNVASTGDISSIAPIVRTGPVPTVALDVAALGGMYAGKIHLVGTEAGLGVSNAGEIGASSGNVTIDVNGNISNSNRIVANANVSIQANNIVNTGASIEAGQQLNIQANSLSGDGKVLASGDAFVTLVDDYIHMNTGELQADGNLTFTTSGTVTNQAQMLAGNHMVINAMRIDNQNTIYANNDLTLNATDIANNANAEITGHNTYINADGTFTNRGLVDGSNTFISANTFNNVGTGSIFGDHIALNVATLNNHAELVSLVNSSAVIAARARLDIGAQTISNQDHSLLFSAGDMAIGGALDATQQATTAIGEPQANTLINHGATIEALGNMKLNVANLQNTNSNITTQLVLDSSRLIQEVQPEGWSSRYDVSRFPTIFNYGIEAQRFVNESGQVVAYFEDYSFFNYTETTSSTHLLSSQPAQLSSGGNMHLLGNVTNSDSKIIAGADLEISGATLKNVNAQGQVVKSYSGWVQFRDWDGDDEELEFGRQNPFNPASNVSTFNLSTSQVSTYTDPNIVGAASGTTIASLSSNPLPSNSLYTPTANPTATYLIETNPRFANYRTWLSSDYMLNQLSYDPATTTKRLGDGFYEQKLVREQVATLTGKRFLEGYASDEAQYQALMMQGITFAKAFNLTPGIALTDLQMAQLTSDIVWLVEQTVTLPDGNTVQALVPKVYAKLKDGDISNAGALLAGNNVNLNMTGDISNAGTIGSRNLMVLTADNINNFAGNVSAKDALLTAQRDINNIGGSVTAQNSMHLNGARDINVISTTQSAENFFGQSTFTRTNLDRVAGLYVTGGQGLMVASAGNDFHMDAAQLVNSANSTSNQTVLKAGNNLTLDTVEIAEQNNSIENSKRFNKSGSTEEVGTQIQTKGDITLLAGNDLSTKAASITSRNGEFQGVAGGDITIKEGRATHNSSVGQHKKKSNGLSSKTSTRVDSFESDTSIGSNLSAESINLVAGANIANNESGTVQQRTGELTIQGSNVVATNDLKLNAGSDINLTASQNLSEESHYSKVKSSGLSSSGASVTLGNSKLTTTNDSQQVTNFGSTVGSIQGNVNINSGKTYNQTGSDVLTPQGDINIAAQQVDIVAATDTYNSQQTMKYKQSGITLAIASSALNLAQNIANSTQGVIESDNTKNKILNALQTYASASTLMEQKDGIASAVKAGDAQGVADAAGVRVSISIGSSKASSTSTTNATVSQESLLKAGGDINIKVTQENINVVGSKILAAQNITFDAVKDINLIAGADTETNQSKNKSSSNSVGISFGIGENTGFSMDIAASRGKGNANSDSTIYTNTQVEAGETLKLKSGGDANLIGANITGKQVTANIGHDLNLQSLQDIATSKAKQKNTGVSISIPVGTGTGMGRGSINQSKQESRSNYVSVYEQTSINAGSEGFHIITKGNTDLNGSIITSEASPDKNLLLTGTLTTSKIQNHMDAKSSSSTAGLSTDILNSKYAALKGATSNLINNGKASVSDDSTTLSAIAPARIVITNQEVQQQLIGQTAEQTINGLNRDTSNTNRVLEKPDVVTLQNEVQQQQADNILLLTTATSFTDEAFRKMFISKATVNVLVRNPDGSIKHGEDGKPLFRELTLEEKMNLQPSADGKIYIANNGINNTIEAAAKYAEQHSNANGEQYFIYFTIANNDISELLIAGYQNFLENGTTGLTNATQENVNMMQQYGTTGLHIDGHSRGGLTTGNALEYLNSQGNVGTLGNTTIHLFGSAYNALQADNLLSNLQGRDMVTDATQKNNMVVQQQTHSVDFVGYLLGNNPNTGGSIPEGSSFIKETTRIMGGKNTVHSCYGNGGDDCSALWNGYMPVLTPVRTYSNE